MKFAQSIILLLAFSGSNALAQQTLALHDQLTRDQLLDETSGPGFEIFRNAFAPNSDGFIQPENYPFFPTSGNFTNGANTKNMVFSTSEAKKYLFVWVNRCTSTPNSECGINPRGNLPEIQGNRFFFSSVTKANECTEAQLWQSMNASTTARNNIINAGMTPAVPDIETVNGRETRVGILGINSRNLPTTSISAQTWLGVADKNGNRPTNNGYVDTCLLEPSVFRNEDGERRILRKAINGVVLDYEPQDGRTPRQTVEFLTEARRIIKHPRFAVEFDTPSTEISLELTMCEIDIDREACRNEVLTKEIGFWTNPLTSLTTTTDNGITTTPIPNLAPLGSGAATLALMDFVSVLAFYRHDENLTGRSISAELRAQERVYRPRFRDLGKFYVTLGLGLEELGTKASLELISDVSNYVRSRGYRGVATWNNRARQRSDAYIKQIACLIATPNNQSVACELE